MYTETDTEKFITLQIDSTFHLRKNVFSPPFESKRVGFSWESHVLYIDGIFCGAAANLAFPSLVLTTFVSMAAG